MKKIALAGCLLATQLLSAATGIINHDNARYRVDAFDSSGMRNRFYVEPRETSNLIPTIARDITQVAIEPAEAPDTGFPSKNFVDVSNKKHVEIKGGKIQ